MAVLLKSMEMNYMENERMIPVVEIKVPGKYYLYPKKRGEKQSLIELDETGYYFYNLIKRYRSNSEIKSIVCNKYHLDEQTDGNRVLNDNILFVWKVISKALK